MRASALQPRSPTRGMNHDRSLKVVHSTPPTRPTLPITVVILLAVIFQAPSSYAFFVRDADGAWRSVSWEKRSNPGDLLKLPLTNNNDKSYSVRYLATLPLLHLTSLITGCGADGHTIPMAVSLSQNHIVVASSPSPRQPGLFVRCPHSYMYRHIVNSSLLKVTIHSTPQPP